MTVANQPAPTPQNVPVDRVVQTMGKVREAIEQVIEGKSEQIDLALIVLLAEGHLLVEDVPGVGKTMLARAMATAIDCTVRRLQFTPDLLPSDITGVSVYNQVSHEFEFKPGGIFANIVVGDEINRASPKTQSALLEAMAERQVSSDGITHQLERPFMVIATQNPIEMEGTYPLPEAQRDRFMARVEMGYPTRRAELDMLDNHGATDPLRELQPVASKEEIVELVGIVRQVYVADAVKDFIIDIVTKTRDTGDLRLGASPRSSLALLRAARARAAMKGRDYAIPEDVQVLAVPVLSHRVLPSTASQLGGRSVRDILSDVVASVEIPDRR